MKYKIWYLFSAIMLLILACQKPSDKLKFKGGEIYYTAKVTIDEAKNLGAYLVDQKFIDENNATNVVVELSKDSATYLFRVVIKDGVEKDENYCNSFKIMASEISEKVFQGAKVDVHLCDKDLKTIKTLPFEMKKEVLDVFKGQKIIIKSNELYFDENISKSEAEQIGVFLESDGFYKSNKRIVKIEKAKERYIFKMYTTNEFAQNEDSVKKISIYSKLLSLRFFKENPVDLVLVDKDLNTLKEVKFKK